MKLPTLLLLLLLALALGGFGGIEPPAGSPQELAIAEILQPSAALIHVADSEAYLKNAGLGENSEHTRQIPVVIVTSSKGNCDLVESYKLEVNSYIQKPVAFEAFAKEVANVDLYSVLINKVPI